MDPTDKFAKLSALFEQHTKLSETIRDEQMRSRSLRIEHNDAIQERRQALEACLRSGDRAEYGTFEECWTFSRAVRIKERLRSTIARA